MLRVSRPLAFKASPVLLKAFGKWDPRLIGDMIRPFNWRESTEGYQAHSMVGWMEDFQGNQGMPAKPFWVRLYRGYGIFFFMWFGGWMYYLFHMGMKTPGCPWSAKYDPSRERAF